MTPKEQKDEELVEKWFSRIEGAERYFSDWEKRFKCKRLNDYIEGRSVGTNCRYSLNLIYSSIRIKRPALLFTRPEFKVIPKPWKQEWQPEMAYRIARLKEDTLNTFIQDSALKFSQEIDMAILDSWSYFGMIEVGYGANWILNPNAGLPVLKSDYEEAGNSDKDLGKTLQEPDEIPEKEYVYFKRIPAHRFRVGGSDSHDLARCSWVGYYEFVRAEDIISNKKFLDNVDPKKDWAGGRSDDYYFDPDKEERDLEAQGDYVKIWKIWDLRKKEFNIFNSSPQKWIYNEEFDRLPLFGLRFDMRRAGWYPIPVIYNWINPQDEVNESREQMRQHRKRARQMWQAQKDSIDPDEKDKFINSPDGTIIETKIENAIKEIPNAPLDASIVSTYQIGTVEFDKISGTSNNQRGVSDRVTATEANTIESRTRIREDSDRVVVAEWLCDIAKETLNIIIERFSNEFFIKRTSDENDKEVGEEVKLLEETYEIVSADQMDDGADFDVDVSVNSMSPVTNEVEEKNFLKFMAVLQNYPILALHPAVIREAAYKCGYRNEKVIGHLSEMARLAMIAKINEGQAQLNAQNAYAQNLEQGNQGGMAPGQEIMGGPMAQNQVQNATPPDIEQIRQQLG